MPHVKNQLNFNTILIIIVGALVTLMIKKLDDGNTLLIQLSTRMNAVELRIDKLETASRNKL